MANPSLRPSRFLLVLLTALATSIASTARADGADPKPLSRPHPEYPRYAVRNGVEGSVLVEFSIDAWGRVVAPRVIEATPAGIFDAAALEAVASWRYEAIGTETPHRRVRLTFQKDDARRRSTEVAARPTAPSVPATAFWLPPAVPAEVPSAALMRPPAPAVAPAGYPVPDGW